MLTASAGLSVVYDNGYGRTVDVTVSSDQMESGPVKLQGVVLAPGKPQGAIPVSLKGVKFKEQTGQTTHVPLTVAIKDQHSGAQLSQTVSVDVSGMPVPEIGNIELVGTLKIREAANPETTFLRVYYTYGMDRVLVKAKVVSDWGVNGSALVTLNGTYFDIPLSGTPTLVDLQTMTLTIDYDAFRQPITEEVQVNISSIPDPVINTTKTALTGNALKTYVAVTGTSLRVYYTEGWGRTGVSATVTTTWGVSGSINNLTLASGSGDNNKYFDIPLRGTPTKPGTALPVTITVQFEPNLDPLEETRVTVPVTASFTPLGISTPTTSLTLTEVGDASAQVITLNYDPGEGRALKAINIVTDVPTTNNKTVYPDPAVGARRTTVGKSLTYSENLAQGSGSFSIPLEGAPKGWSSGTDYTMNIEVTYYEPGLARDLTIQLENPIPVTVALGAKRGFEPETLQYGIANDPGSTGGAQGSYVITNNVFAYNTVWVDANGDGGVDEGEVWLDRNIGATTATPPAYGATTVGYDPSYGALTQWGMPYIHLKFWDSANSRYRWLGSDNAYNANRFGLSVMYRGYWFGTTYFGANANPPVLPTNFGDYYNIDVLEHGGGTGGATLIYFTGGDVCPKGFSVPTAQQWINVTEGITGLTFTTPAKNINAELAAESTDAVAAMISSPLHLPLVGMSWRPDNNTAPTTVNQNKMAVYAVKDRAEQGTNGVFMPYIAFGLIQANIAASQPNLVASNNIKLLNHPTTGNQSGHAINFGVHVRCIRTTVAEPLPATQPEPKTANFNKNEMPAGW